MFEKTLQAKITLTTVKIKKMFESKNWKLFVDNNKYVERKCYLKLNETLLLRKVLILTFKKNSWLRSAGRNRKSFRNVFLGGEETVMGYNVKKCSPRDKTDVED